MSYRLLLILLWAMAVGLFLASLMIGPAGLDLAT